MSVLKQGFLVRKVTNKSCNKTLFKLNLLSWLSKDEGCHFPVLGSSTSHMENPLVCSSWRSSVILPQDWAEHTSGMFVAGGSIASVPCAGVWQTGGRPLYYVYADEYMHTLLYQFQESLHKRPMWDALRWWSMPSCSPWCQNDFEARNTVFFIHINCSGTLNGSQVTLSLRIFQLHEYALGFFIGAVRPGSNVVCCNPASSLAVSHINTGCLQAVQQRRQGIPAAGSQWHREGAVGPCHQCRHQVHGHSAHLLHSGDCECEFWLNCDHCHFADSGGSLPLYTATCFSTRELNFVAEWL